MSFDNTYMKNRNEKKPLLLIIMDGVGWQEKDNGNVLLHAHIPHLRKVVSEQPFRTLTAHGTAVGLPTDDDMGNSEVGHNALGCGQIFSQGAKLVNESIEDGSIYESKTWKDLLKAVGTENTLHFIGLLSDGSVHSHINHLFSLLERSKADGIRRVAVHILLDGRDVGAQSSLEYVDQLEEKLAELRSDWFDAMIASGGGRMVITMDRYENDWGMVARGWQTHVLGEGEMYPSARAAIEDARAHDPDISDQYLPPFVIERYGIPVSPVMDGDGVVLFNFRGDRAMEISRAFDEGESFTEFERKRVPEVYYAGMLEYDGDLHIPTHYLVEPPKIRNTLSEQMVANGLRQFAVSETQKFGHVTYFWNGNRTEPFSKELETWHEVASDNLPFDLKPWMKAYEITEAIIEAMSLQFYDFIRCNYPNGDMVGHTGNYQAATIAIETVDLSLNRLLHAAEKYGYGVMIVADHGNCDEMFMPQKKGDDLLVPKTSHTLAPVPFVLMGYPERELITEPGFGLANVAATVADVLGFDAHPSWEPSLLKAIE